MGRALHYVDVAAIVQVAMDGSSARSLMLACPSSCGRYSLLVLIVVLSLTVSSHAVVPLLPHTFETAMNSRVAAEKTARLAVHGSRTAACEQQSCWRYAMAAARYRRI